ncbi:peptide/nickel transport system permease protein [Catenulispora sp. MAP5-51]|uniref:ABC transporter permease n=1 Tax=Catenulispora sp. MAP5-51 TaxID=3156298 RepID=UPI003516C425
MSTSLTRAGDGAPFETIDVPGAPNTGATPSSRRGLVLRRFRRNKSAVLGLCLLVFLFVAAFAGPALTKWDYAKHDYRAFLSAPSGDHWFGTTQGGQDVYALVLHGAQKSLVIGLLVALMSTTAAAVVGSCAGYFGGYADTALSWFINLMLVVPSLLVLAIMSPWFKGSSWLLFAVLLAAFNWMVTAKVVRGYSQTIKHRDFVRAARYMGVGAPRIIIRHILPNVASLLIIDATINVGLAIISESALSFLGFGIQPPDVSLGTVISAGKNSAVEHPWLFVFPAGFLLLICLAVNFIGDGLRDAMDPTSKGGSA